MEKLITVFGATGQQGGTVARALKRSGTFKVRGVTRNPDGDKAKALQALGIEVVKASLDDPESIATAISGSYGVFSVTNYWEFMDKEREIRQGISVADKCKLAQVKHVVYSGLESVKEITGWDCPHFDAKGEVEKYLDRVGIPNTSVRCSGYFQTFLSTIAGYQKQEDGSYIMTTCMQGSMYGVDIDDLGEVVVSVFKDPQTYIGKKIGVAGDHRTFEQLMDTVSKVTGKNIKIAKIPHEVFAKFPIPGADDIAAMFHFYDHGNPVRDIQLTKQLNPNTHSFQEWAEKNKDNFNF